MASTSAALPPDFYDKKPLVNEPATLIGVCTTFMVLLWLTTSIRLYIRFFIARAPGWDDLFIVLAAAHVTMGAIATCVATKYGLGDHIYLLSPGDIRSFLICHYLLGASYVGGTAYIKISLLLQYLRIFERGTKIYRITQLTLVVIGLWAFAFIFMNWFACFPSPANFWNRKSEGCYASFSPNVNIAVRTIEAQAGSNMTWDIIVLAIAFRLLFEKDGPINRRGLLVLLSMGVVSCAFGVWRFTVVVTSEAGSSSSDITWIEPMPQLLSIVEVGMACLCATTPFFWPVIQEALSKIFVSYEFKVVTESRWDDNQVEELGSGNVTESQHELVMPKSAHKEMPIEARSIHKPWGSYGGSSFAEDFGEYSPVSPAQSGGIVEKGRLTDHERGSIEQ